MTAPLPPGAEATLREEAERLQADMARRCTTDADCPLCRGAILNALRSAYTLADQARKEKDAAIATEYAERQRFAGLKYPPNCGPRDDAFGKAVAADAIAESIKHGSIDKAAEAWEAARKFPREAE